MINDGNKKSLIPQARFKTGPDTGGQTTGGLRMPRVLGSGSATEGGGRIIVSETKTPNSWRREFPETAVVIVTKPLTIKKGTDVNKFQIVPGTVNTEVPTLGGIAINAATPPEFTVSADLWAWLKIITTFGSPDTYVVTVETTATDSPPTAEAITATTFTSCFLMGHVEYTAGSPATYLIVHDHGGGNLGIESFGAVNLWWTK